MKRDEPVCALCRGDGETMTHVKVVTCHVIEDDEDVGIESGGIESRKGISSVTWSLMMMHLFVVLLSVVALYKTVTAVGFRAFERAGQHAMRDIVDTFGVTHSVDVFDIIEEMIESDELIGS